MFRQIDIYCERLGPGLWAEPVNALTNLAFLLAALCAWRHARRRGGPDLWSGILIAIVALIGIGSFLFHTFAQYWALLADVIPITLFIHLYLFLALRRFFGLGLRPAAGLYALLVAFDMLVVRRLVPEGEAIAWANGSEQYLFPLVAMALFLPFMIGYRVAGTGLLVLAAGVFVLSLGARTLDAAICPAFPPGTHFLWHVLNAVMLGLLLVLAIRHAPQPGGSRRADGHAREPAGN